MKILLVVLLGLALRLISLNQSFWLDEATTANVAAMSVREILTNFSPGDFHPLLYYLLAHFWSNFFGISEVSLRIISVLAGSVAIYVLYLMGKELIGRKSGIIAALLLATSGLHIYYSQEARMYGLVTLLVSYLVYLFAKLTKRSRVGDWILFAIFLALVGMTDYVALLIIPALWVYAWTKKLKAPWWRKFLASHIILLGVGLLWLPTFLKQLSAGLSVKSYSPSWWQILGQTNFKQLILIPTKFVFGRINMEANIQQVLIAGAAFVVFGFLLTKARQRLIWFWLVIPIALGVLISFWIPTLSYLRYLFVLPAFYLLVTAGLKNIPGKLSRVLVAVIIGFNLLASSLYLFSSKNHREDWRGLTRFIQNESIGKNSAVVFPADSQQEAYRYYDKITYRYYDGNAKIVTREEIDTGFSEVWLVRYVQEISDPSNMARSKIEDLGYMKTNEHNFNGVVVWRYSRN